jgi:hypothetical protein
MRSPSSSSSAAIVAQVSWKSALFAGWLVTLLRIEAALEVV